MKRSLLGTITGLTILGLSTPASATSVDLGDISAGESAGSSLFYSDGGVVIGDTWSFTITRGPARCHRRDSADFRRWYGIDGLVVTSANMTFHYVAADNTYRFTAVLAAGDYSFDVVGATSGVLGGQYQVILGGVVPQ